MSSEPQTLKRSLFHSLFSRFFSPVCCFRSARIGAQASTLRIRRSDDWEDGFWVSEEDCPHWSPDGKYRHPVTKAAENYWNFTDRTSQPGDDAYAEPKL